MAQTPTIGTSVQGDFDGDGKKEYAFSVLLKEAVGNPMEDGTAAEYAVNFSTEKISTIEAGCCYITLVNEGDLNNDGLDELSLFQAPVNGNTSTMVTYSFKNGKWIEIVASYMVPTREDFLSDEEIQELVFIENGHIYYLDTDMSDENMPLIKVKVN